MVFTTYALPTPKEEVCDTNDATFLFGTLVANVLANVESVKITRTQPTPVRNRVYSAVLND
jgi:hypothetical protein